MSFLLLAIVASSVISGAAVWYCFRLQARTLRIQSELDSMRDLVKAMGESIATQFDARKEIMATDEVRIQELDHRTGEIERRINTQLENARNQLAGAHAAIEKVVDLTVAVSNDHVTALEAKLTNEIAVLNKRLEATANHIVESCSRAISRLLAPAQENKAPVKNLTNGRAARAAPRGKSAGAA